MSDQIGKLDGQNSNSVLVNDHQVLREEDQEAAVDLVVHRDLAVHQVSLVIAVPLRTESTTGGREIGRKEEEMSM